MEIHEKKHFRYVFRKVISAYQRKRESGSLGHHLIGPSTHPLQPMPCDIDFIVDVEKAAKAALSDLDYQMFTKLFIKKNTQYAQRVERALGEVAFREWKHSLQEAIGVEFVSRGIHPLEDYLYLPSDKAPGYQNCKCGDPKHRAGKGSDLWCRCGCKLNMAHHAVGARIADCRRLSLWCRVCSEGRDGH